MQISIVIPAHNEEDYLKDCLNSFVRQSLIPNQLIIVDDNSSDNTLIIAQEFSKKHGWIQVVQNTSTDEHIPGKKVVDTFNVGLSHATNYDLIGKFDADIILPPNYFETMVNHFRSKWKLGMCSGLLFIKKENEWVYENIADKTHIRGPIKLYQKACFNKIGGLRPSVGWDTVDVLLANYYDFEVLTDASLHVKHLRPTGHSYSKKNKLAKGQALYKMRYRLPLAKLTALKMAWQAKSPVLYFNTVFGYLNAWISGLPRFVTKKEGAFIRKFRWKGIFKKLLNQL